MNKATLALLSFAVALVACGKKDAAELTGAAPAAPVTQAAAAPAPSVEPAPSPSAEPSAEQREAEQKRQLMAYAEMEDRYINDPRAQWATAAKASSSFGEATPPASATESRAWKATGAVDGSEWQNNQQDIGFDWLDLDFAKPVRATEVRIVVPHGDGVEAISKLELRDVDGKLHTVWSDISDVKRDKRGARTWFVRSFEKTTFQARGVKLTIANNVERGYKGVDAVQLVGD